MNIARIDLTSVRLLVLCAESGSVSRAAPRAAMSISGASYKLRAMEDLLGIPIFHRHRHGLEPTAAGVPIIDRCSQVLDLVGEIVQLAKASSRARDACICRSCGRTTDGSQTSFPSASAARP